MRDEHIEDIERVLRIKFPEEQLDIITHSGAPANVISCAGSGKTTLMIAKLLYMQLKYNINPSAMCVISFNKTAVKEIEDRYNKAAVMLGLSIKKITFKTFHALYLMVLKHFDKSTRIAGDSQATTLYNRAFFEKSGDKSDACREDILRIRGFALNNMITSQRLLFSNPQFVTSSITEQDYLNVIKRFNELKTEEEIVDFDDLQLQMFKLLENNPDAKDMVHRAWDYWFVDEYQDISKIQSDILEMSVKNKNNLVTIGDEDQCIYEFRGSKVDFILDFPVFYPNAKRYVMNYNYRCPEVILSRAERLINRNVKRIQKNMKAYKPGGTFVVTEHKSPMYASMEIAQRINEDYIENEKLSEIAVLYRNNSQQLFIVDQLIQLSVPVKVGKENNLLHNHMFTTDILKIIDLAVDTTDPYAFKDIFHKICHNRVSKKEIVMISNKMISTGDTFEDCLEMYQKGKVAETSEVLKEIKDLVEAKEPMIQILNKVIAIYADFITFMGSGTRMTMEEANDIIQYLYFIAENKSYRQFLFYIERAKSLVTLYKDDKEAVTVTTMHTVKGLEYNNVYIVDASDYVIPNIKKVNSLQENFGNDVANDHIEQERRLMYVACTRAKKKLQITYCSDHASEFITDMLDEEHKLGEGTIVITNKGNK